MMVILHDNRLSTLPLVTAYPPLVENENAYASERRLVAAFHHRVCSGVGLQIRDKTSFYA